MRNPKYKEQTKGYIIEIGKKSILQGEAVQEMGGGREGWQMKKGIKMH